MSWKQNSKIRQGGTLWGGGGKICNLMWCVHHLSYIYPFFIMLVIFLNDVEKNNWAESVGLLMRNCDE